MADPIEYHAALVTAHAVSAIVGATGAYASGFAYLLRRKDIPASRSDSRFSAFGSALAAGGLTALVLTGALLVASDPGKHLATPAFQAKMTMVASLLAAASVSRLARKSRAIFLARAAVAAVSWAGAIALGLRVGASASYGEIMIVYAVGLAVAVDVAFAARKAVLPSPSAPPASVRATRNA